MASISGKDQQSEYNRQYYINNRERLLARHRAWNQANKPYMSRYYAAHKEEIAARRKLKRQSQAV